MNVFQTITEKAGKAELPFLIIGGYAVMAHGFVRSTEDLDLLVRVGHRARWCELLEGMEMTIYRDGQTFLQFNAPPGGRLPVDLMFVADEVFGRMQLKAEKSIFGGVTIGVVSLLQLIALKCHAVRNTKGLRVLKDSDDLIHLIQINGLDLKEPELRATILTHGNQELYDKLQRACAPD